VVWWELEHLIPSTSSYVVYLLSFLFIPLFLLLTFHSSLFTLCCSYLPSSHLFHHPLLLLLSTSLFSYISPSHTSTSFYLLTTRLSLPFTSSVDRCLSAWRILTIVTWTLAVIPSRCRRYGEPLNTANRYPTTRPTLYCMCEVLDFSDAYQSVFNKVNLRKSISMHQRLPCLSLSLSFSSILSLCHISFISHQYTCLLLCSSLFLSLTLFQGSDMRAHRQ
jgi:hypothetical protein